MTGNQHQGREGTDSSTGWFTGLVVQMCKKWSRYTQYTTEGWTVSWVPVPFHQQIICSLISHWLCCPAFIKLLIKVILVLLLTTDQLCTWHYGYTGHQHPALVIPPATFFLSLTFLWFSFGRNCRGSGQDHSCLPFFQSSSLTHRLFGSVEIGTPS